MMRAIRQQITTISRGTISHNRLSYYACYTSVAGEPVRLKKYNNHVPTTTCQKIALAISSAFTVFANPERGDMLAVLGEVTGNDALVHIREKMVQNPTGAQLLKEKPSIRSNTIDFQALENLPHNTFGYAYTQFMNAHGFEADGRSHVRFVDNDELAFIMQRHRELHDFYHVLFGLPPTVFGELALKYVELVQTKLPVAAFSTIVGPLRLTSSERHQLQTVYLPWAYRAGRKAAFLLNVRFEDLLTEPIDKVRKDLNIEVAPPFKCD